MGSEAATADTPGREPRDAQRWRAVLQRDPQYDGRFVYAVTSTRIYCRPTCASRRPGRDRVRFYESPAEAERDGFRACRRCRPRSAEPSRVVQAVKLACSYLDARPDRPVTLERLGRVTGMSPWHLQRSFRRITGLSPRDYQAAKRTGRLRRELRRGESVAEATYGAGFGSGSRVYERAAVDLGMTPATYRRGGRGARIVYRVASTAVGRVLVASTDRGVCAVLLGDTPAGLVESLRREFPAARLERGGPDAQPWLEAVVDAAAGAANRTDIPLDVRATAFQWRVWRTLQAIPPGETRSYRDVARMLGDDRAARAVARACAANRAALVVPCHRVVRQDGTLGGYRWGLDRKARLLALEQQASASLPRS